MPKKTQYRQKDSEKEENISGDISFPDKNRDLSNIFYPIIISIIFLIVKSI